MILFLILNFSFPQARTLAGTHSISYICLRMETLLILIAVAAVGGCIVLGAFWLRAKSAAADAQTARAVAERYAAELELRQAASEQELRTTRERSEAEIRTLIEARTKAEAEVEALDRKIREAKAEREQAEELLRVQFRNLANDILGEQTKQFKETNREALDLLLKPFKENIADFRTRVEQIYSTEREQHGELKGELKNLMELNRRITAETTNLTNALKGNSKVQGDWGEMILDTILDNSNLIRGVHYDCQVTIKDDAGSNQRPDVVLYLPEGKRIVIDSKVSLTAFVEWVGAEEEGVRARYLAAHVASVRQHVNELSRKEYQRLLESPDFVIMFIPNEPAFLAAMQHDSAIWSDAYEKKVVISSPTNLFALLKLVDDLWRRNEQSRNQEQIIKYGTTLYEQFVAFTSSLEGVGQALDLARTKYDDAYKRLHTGNNNIVRTGERLRRLGLPTSKRPSQQLLDETDGLDMEEDMPVVGDGVEKSE